jgi:hypothetical protein
MNKFVTFTSAHNEAKISINIEAVSLVIDHAATVNDHAAAEGRPATLILVQGQAEAFGVKEDYTKVMRSMGV